MGFIHVVRPLWSRLVWLAIHDDFTVCTCKSLQEHVSTATGTDWSCWAACCSLLTCWESYSRNPCEGTRRWCWRWGRQCGKNLHWERNTLCQRVGKSGKLSLTKCSASKSTMEWLNSSQTVSWRQNTTQQRSRLFLLFFFLGNSSGVWLGDSNLWCGPYVCATSNCRRLSSPMNC